MGMEKQMDLRVHSPFRCSSLKYSNMRTVGPGLDMFCGACVTQSH